MKSITLYLWRRGFVQLSTADFPRQAPRQSPRSRRSHAGRCSPAGGVEVPSLYYGTLLAKLVEDGHCSSFGHYTQPESPLRRHWNLVPIFCHKSLTKFSVDNRSQLNTWNAGIGFCYVSFYQRIVYYDVHLCKSLCF